MDLSRIAAILCCCPRSWQGESRYSRAFLPGYLLLFTRPASRLSRREWSVRVREYIEHNYMRDIGLTDLTQASVYARLCQPCSEGQNRVTF